MVTAARLIELRDMLMEAASEGHSNDWCVDVAEALNELLTRRALGPLWRADPHHEDHE